MPSFVGVLKINRNDGNFINGDTLVLSPTNSSKIYNGAASGITGDFAATVTLFSATNTFDSDLIDATGDKIATGT